MRVLSAGTPGLLLALLLAASSASAATLLVPAEYGTIQAAVDASDPGGGDEVVVGAGVYEEQVVITHDVTITGAGVGVTVLRAPTYMAHTVHALHFNAVIHAESPLGAVVLRDFTLEGAGRGREQTRFTGIMYDRCGGVTERVAINNFHEAAVTNPNSGIGFYAYSEPDDGLQLRVQDVTINTFQKAGFVCFGNGCEMDLRQIVADPTGFHQITVQNGFELLNSSTGSITDCTARLCWYDGSYFPGATSCGFVFYYAREWTVTNTLADRNQTGFYFLATDMTLTGSEVIGYPDQLSGNYGVVTTGLSAAQALTSRLARPRTLTIAETLPTDDQTKSAVLDGCRLYGGQVPGSLGLVGVSGLGENSLEVENCEIAAWEVGLRTFETSGQVVGRARTCRIQDNMSLAVLAETLQPFDARGNFWGDPSGPFHPTANPDGLGGEVSDNVIFDPWLQGNVVCAPVPQYIALADADGNGYSRDLVVRYLGSEGAPVYGYSAEITWNQEKLAATSGDFSRPDEGLFQAAVLFQVLPITDGFRVEAALGGDQTGIPSGEMFKVRFHLVGEPDYVEIPINLTVRHLRDSQNQEIEGSQADDGLVIGDLKAPEFSLLKLNNITLPHTNEFAKNDDQISIQATATDGDPLFGRSSFVGDFLFLFGIPGYLRVPDSFLDDTATWLELPAVLYPADGRVTYAVMATDPAGNTAIADSTITADNTPPQPVGNLTALTGPNQIDLQWDDPAGLDENLRQVSIRSRRTQLYPYYTEPEPAYPASPSDGEEVYTGLGNSVTALYASDGSQRDIVSFQAFAVDQVGHVSVTADGSRDRAANYFLGDVTAGPNPGYDQVTDIYDLSRLGDTFGLVDSDPGFNAECDVGPTSDGTDLGLPLPDGAIDLDDLMIFADRFGAAANSQPAAITAVAAANPELSWVRQAPDLWILELTAPCPELKALRLQGTLPAGLTVNVAGGELLTRQSAPIFLHTMPANLDVTVALLGQGAGFTGSGELLRVTTSRPLGRLVARLEARSVTNAPLATRLADELEPAPVPSVFALRGNYPNPFNPETAIAFDLPSPQTVRLVVYGLDGRRVARLFHGRLAAGRHEVAWRGRDDRQRQVAAGTYLYRLEAGPWSATGKLNLVK